jgi:hypothetical protein
MPAIMVDTFSESDDIKLASYYTTPRDSARQEGTAQERRSSESEKRRSEESKQRRAGEAEARRTGESQERRRY